jgi:hypothetical protein
MEPTDVADRVLEEYRRDAQPVAERIAPRKPGARDCSWTGLQAIEPVRLSACKVNLLTHFVASGVVQCGFCPQPSNNLVRFNERGKGESIAAVARRSLWHQRRWTAPWRDTRVKK